jgi:hypothetical protein
MIGRNIKDALGGLAILLFFAALIFIGLRCVGGCTPAEANAMQLSAENAAAVAQYDLALVECQQAARQRPKEQRFEAYTDCEQAVSKHFCAESQELRREWKRCAELGLGEP